MLRGRPIAWGVSTGASSVAVVCSSDAELAGYKGGDVGITMTYKGLHNTVAVTAPLTKAEARTLAARLLEYAA